MNNSRLEREVNNTLETLTSYIGDLMNEIEELEKENDKKDQEIDRLQDIIDKSE